MFKSGLAVHAVAPATWEVKTGRLTSLGPAWAIQQDATPGVGALYCTDSLKSVVIADDHRVNDVKQQHYSLPVFQP